MKLKNILKELEHERKHMLKQVERLEKGMAALAGLSGSRKMKGGARKKSKMSAKGRAAIAAAQRARWAKIKAVKGR
jgi:hypothetical protein